MLEKKESKDSKNRVFVNITIGLAGITAILYASLFLMMTKDKNESNVYGFKQYEVEVIEKLDDVISDVQTNYIITVRISDSKEADFIIGKGDYKNINIGDKIHVISNGEELRLGTLKQVGVISKVVAEQ